MTPPRLSVDAPAGPPILTHPQNDLAHRLALAWALAGAQPASVAHRWLGALAAAGRGGLPRVSVVLGEAARLFPGYMNLTDDALALHVSTYALGPEYSGGTVPDPHEAACDAHGGGQCSCPAEVVAGGMR